MTISISKALQEKHDKIAADYFAKHGTIYETKEKPVAELKNMKCGGLSPALRNLKFRVADEAQSKALQEVLLAQGYDWEFHSYKGTVQPLDNTLFANAKKRLLYCAASGGSYEWTDTASFIATHTAPERTLEDAYTQPSSENFFESAKASSELVCPWLENTGEMPVDGYVLVDIEMRDGEGELCLGARNYRWRFLDSDGDIVKWRYSRAEDWFKAPKTSHDGVTFKADGSMYTMVGGVKKDIFSRGDKGELLVHVPEPLEGATYDSDGNMVSLKVGSLKSVASNGGGRMTWGTLDTAKNCAFSTPAEATARNKYMREIKPNVWVDCYDVIRAFGVVDPCLQHMAKKVLACGQRHHKDEYEDLKDVLASAKRALEIYEEWHK